MAQLGHYYNQQGRSEFRVFAPEKQHVSVVLTADNHTLPLSRDEIGYWYGEFERLPHGTLYKLEVDGNVFPDPASRYQPEGVHGPSMVTDVPRAGAPAGWTGIKMSDAIIYELHLGTFTDEGTLKAAAARLPYLQELGVNVIELLPLAAFPGKRNWGYDGTFHFALQESYGDYRDLKSFIEASRALGMAVVLDVVYNHFGPEGNYSGCFAPYTKQADTPWGDAINFDEAYNYGVREYFLENTRYWLQQVGFDGFRMDAVSLIFDNMPVHILREFTDLARSIGAEEGREVLMIAEHLRNNKYVTADPGFNYHSQWNDDLNHAIFAKLTGESGGHYVNFGAFGDVVKALTHGFVLDGTRFDKHYKYFTGTDGSDTHGSEHVVHIQDHDQVGNRALGDRMIATYGRDKALLGITAVMASPFVPMLWMGEEYGERSPFLFFEDFSEQVIIDGAREGRKADFAFEGIEPDDPHAIETFEKSKLRWEQAQTEEGQSILAYYKALIAMKRAGQLGPRELDKVEVKGDESSGIITVETAATLTVMNFSGEARSYQPAACWQSYISTVSPAAAGALAPYSAVIYQRAG